MTDVPVWKRDFVFNLTSLVRTLHTAQATMHLSDSDLCVAEALISHQQTVAVRFCVMAHAHSSTFRPFEGVLHQPVNFCCRELRRISLRSLMPPKWLSRRTCTLLRPSRKHVVPASFIPLRSLHASSLRTADVTPLRKQLKDASKRARGPVGTKQKTGIPKDDRLSQWELTVGIEIHAQLNTIRKLFSRKAFVHRLRLRLLTPTRCPS